MSLLLALGLVDELEFDGHGRLLCVRELLGEVTDINAGGNLGTSTAFTSGLTASRR